MPKLQEQSKNILSLRKGEELSILNTAEDHEKMFFGYCSSVQHRF